MKNENEKCNYEMFKMLNSDKFIPFNTHNALFLTLFSDRADVHMTVKGTCADRGEGVPILCGRHKCMVP